MHDGNDYYYYYTVQNNRKIWCWMFCEHVDNFTNNLHIENLSRNQKMLWITKKHVFRVFLRYPKKAGKPMLTCINLWKSTKTDTRTSKPIPPLGSCIFLKGFTDSAIYIYIYIDYIECFYTSIQFDSIFWIPLSMHNFQEVADSYWIPVFHRFDTPNGNLWPL